MNARKQNKNRSGTKKQRRTSNAKGNQVTVNSATLQPDESNSGSNSPPSQEQPTNGRLGRTLPTSEREVSDEITTPYALRLEVRRIRSVPAEHLPGFEKKRLIAETTTQFLNRVGRLYTTPEARCF